MTAQMRLRGFMDEADDRKTPDDFWLRLHNTFRFTIDAAASADNAKLLRYYDESADGLAHSWRAESVWCNPPYSEIAAWIDKAWHEMKAGCHCVVMLIPANRTDLTWWHEHVEPYRDGRGAQNGVTLRVKFLPGRITFKGFSTRAPFGSALLIWEAPA